MSTSGTGAAGSVQGAVPLLYVPDGAERDDLGAFIARVVRLDATSVVRLRAREGRVVAWAPTPFEVLATHAVCGELRPPDLTVAANDLLAALAVVREARIDPGVPVDARWRAELPPARGWRVVRDVPAEELEVLAEQGLALAREHSDQHRGPHGTPPGRLLDQTVLTAAGDGMRVQVPLRCLFGLSGMGFLDTGSPGDRVRVSATEDGTWVRLDARFGAVVRRRHVLLPLLP